MTGIGHVERERLHGADQPAVGEHRRVDAAHQVRRSPSAAVVVARASASSLLRQLAGSVSISSSARPRLMPSETSRACAPSCRSRSMRRSSAAGVSTVSARDSDSALHPLLEALGPVGQQRAVDPGVAFDERGREVPPQHERDDRDDPGDERLRLGVDGHEPELLVEDALRRTAKSSGKNGEPRDVEQDSIEATIASTQPSVIATNSHTRSRQRAGSRAQALQPDQHPGAVGTGRYGDGIGSPQHDLGQPAVRVSHRPPPSAR